jgi:LysM repeat protein
MSRKGFFLIITLQLFFVGFAQKTNNKPVVKQTTKASPYIMHMVKFGETLTKISKMYDVTITEILKANPSLTENNLMPEQIIRVPNKGKVVINTTKDATTVQPKASEKPIVVANNGKLHTVETGQTMYSISKMYGVTVEEIQKWNNLKDFNVKVGSQIIVSNTNTKRDSFVAKSEPISKPNITSTPTKPVQVNKPEQQTAPNEQEETETQKPDIQASDNATQKDLLKIYKEKAATMSIQTAKGTGAPMTTTLGVMETVYFAMHKWLPIGTIIKIKNLVNSKIVYAKVIGKLPDNDENKNVIVRYSLGVKKDLQLQNGKCYLQIEYPN